MLHAHLQYTTSTTTEKVSVKFTEVVWHQGEALRTAAAEEDHRDQQIAEDILVGACPVEVRLVFLVPSCQEVGQAGNLVEDLGTDDDQTCCQEEEKALVCRTRPEQPEYQAFRACQASVPSCQEPVRQHHERGQPTLPLVHPLEEQEAILFPQASQFRYP
jgi:hypothetical protein